MEKKIALLGALLFAGHSMASSQDTPWYAGARLGSTLYTDFEKNQSSQDLDDDSDIGAGLFLGYKINDWFALETGYTHLGKVEVTDDAGMTNQVLDVSGKWTLHPTESFNLFAKIGSSVHKTVGDGKLSGYEDLGLNATAGLGLEYYFTNSFSTRLEYQFYHRIDLNENPYASEWNTHLLSIGFVYSWGEEKTVVVQAPPTVVKMKPVVVEKVVEAPIITAVKKQPTTITPVKKQATSTIVQKTAQIYFSDAKNNLSKSSIKQLQPIINHLSDYSEATIFVIGHTDSRGSSKLNQKLSEQRAQTVSNYLMKEYAIEAQRITTYGAGESEPIATNKTQQGQAKNRRVVVFSPSLSVIEK